MRKDKTEENSVAESFKIYEPKPLSSQDFVPLCIVGILSSLISLKLIVPVFVGLLIGAVCHAVAQFFRSSLEIKGGKLIIKQFAKVNDFDLANLVVESDTALGPFTVQEMVFRGKYTDLSLMKLGSSRILSAEGMLLLAALQRQGAFIDVLGFGKYTRGLTFERLTAAPRAMGTATMLFILGGYGLLANGIILYFRFVDEQETLRRSSFLSTFFTPIGIPAFFILSVAWVCLAIFLINRAIEAKRGILPYAVDLTEDRVKLLKRTKEVFDLKLEEIKQVRVTAHEKGFYRDLVSVELETHYARKYKMLEQGIIIPIGVSNFLEHSRRKGVTVVYQKLRKGADAPDVIWEAKAEKAVDPVESTEAQFTGPSETQVRQTEG